MGAGTQLFHSRRIGLTDGNEPVPVLGGRLGYTLFYNFGYYLRHPLEILYVWEGGMSFHGGLLGVVVASLLFCRRRP